MAAAQLMIAVGIQMISGKYFSLVKFLPSNMLWDLESKANF